MTLNSKGGRKGFHILYRVGKQNPLKEWILVANLVSEFLLPNAPTVRCLNLVLKKDPFTGHCVDNLGLMFDIAYSMKVDGITRQLRCIVF